ncbi:metal-dependent hydrolase [Desulfomarina profundi]|uniref:Metal-dependent hydrolase n=1 Tax=Desulfomarina profundi TaxID=2772557 RepID=A0A8D5FKZ2_9BACT|nr:amidohydrolase family protein [Desulfomarina profundi]BCL60923.1 metal-dependent hydrolase [Desulfomarina profundi]
MKTQSYESCDQLQIFSSDWVVPVSGEVIADGAVVVEKGRILAVGPRCTLLKQFSDGIELYCRAVLMPGLVNCHTHLELSWLKGKMEPGKYGKFTDWISALIKKRGEKGEAGQEEYGTAFSTVLRDLYNSGVGAVVDTGNTIVPDLHGKQMEGQSPFLLRLVEYIAPTKEIEADLFTLIENHKNKNKNKNRINPATAHAVYSTSPRIIQLLKKRSLEQNHLFSIHTAESKSEVEFVRTGKGEFRSFLEQLGRLDGTLDFSAGKFSSVIEYLDYLDVLDERTLLVHCVHISENDIDLIRRRGAIVCLCPGSNRFLDVGRPPVVEMVRAGIPLVLGTDSFASNTKVDLWEEMRLLHEMYEELHAAEILHMATRGVMIPGYEDQVGIIEPGRLVKLLQVSSPELRQCRDGYEVVKELVSGGRPAEISWIV